MYLKQNQISVIKLHVEELRTTKLFRFAKTFEGCINFIKQFVIRTANENNN